MIKKSLKILVIPVLVLFWGTARAEEWDNVEKGMLVAAELSLYADWQQTKIIAAQPDKYHETNFILGKHPSSKQVNAYFIGSAVTTYLIADYLSPSYRKLFLGGMFMLEYSVIQHNKNLGLSVKWGF